MADIVTISATDFVDDSLANIVANYAALQNNFRSSSAPASPVAGQYWIDSSGAADILKVRNRANSAWVTVAPDLSATAGGLLPLTGGTMSGVIAMGSQKITGLASGTASGEAVHKGQVDARVMTASVHLGTISASDEKFLFICPASVTVSDCVIVSELAVTSDASNLWTFQVRNLTASLDLRSAAKSTNGAAITADTAYALGLDQNLSPSTGAVLELQMAKTGSPNNLQELAVMLRYTLAT